MVTTPFSSGRAVGGGSSVVGNGGGGLGAGGAIFINHATVDISDCAFNGNSVTGGAGGGRYFPNQLPGTRGGGFHGDVSNAAFDGGNGGYGWTAIYQGSLATGGADGGGLALAASWLGFGATLGGSGASGGLTDGMPGGAAGIGGGGGGGAPNSSPAGTGGSGGNGGVGGTFGGGGQGGKGGAAAGLLYGGVGGAGGNGGHGGWGAGGGAGGDIGHVHGGVTGNGGAGGAGGDGGFGGGGGKGGVGGGYGLGGYYTANGQRGASGSAGNGGLFGGDGAVDYGGGGAGLGGAIFVNGGGELIITNSSFTNNYATGGASGGGTAEAGEGHGGAIFALGALAMDASVTFGTGTSANGASTSDDNFNAPVAQTLTGSAASELMQGGAGNDTITGLAGNDTIRGAAGDDILSGDQGNDILDGSTGADSMTGGDGSDTYYVDNAGDVVTETNSNAATGGTDLVHSSLATYTLTANVENARIRLSTAANLTGNSLNNVLYAGTGNNVIDGAGGTDTVSYAYGVSGTTGVTLDLRKTTVQATGGSGSDTIRNVENLIGSANADNFIGTSAANRLEGGAGSDALNGYTGADTLIGGDGSDTYYVDNAGDVVTEINSNAATGGTDLVHSSLAAYTLGANVENARIRLGTAADLTGNTLDNVLYAGIGNNIINGAAGVDTVSYIYGVTGTTGVTLDLRSATPQATGVSGSDTLLSIENLIGSANADNFIGTSAANRLEGGAGNDALNGYTGADTLIGGDGSDTYYVDNAGDVVTEINSNAATGGTDLVHSSLATYTLTANVENARIRLSTAADLTGNSLNNVLYAGAGNNTLNGGAGTDTVTYLYGLVSGSTTGIAASLLTGQVTGSSGTDTLISIENLTGSSLADILIGNTGNNTLDGGSGNDTLRGGLGNDTYVVNSTLDSVTENPDEGIDTVNSLRVSYTLGQNIENGRISVTGTASITGNSLNNILYAGAGNNTLNGGLGIDTASYMDASAAVTVSLALTAAQGTGGSGLDTLIAIENLTGSAFADALSGNAAANTLDGGAGIDTMTGGDGSDIYYVRNIGDLVIETNATASTGGVDLVNSYLSAYTLSGNVENGRILATGTANLTGNTLNNLLYAGAGNNALDGGSGIDTVSYAYALTAVSVSLATSTAQGTGGSGTDTLLNIDNLIGSKFHDTLVGDGFANTLSGLDLNDYLSGGAGNDVLLGGNGTDMLIGGLGKDTLTGGAGNDTFVFGALTDTGIISATWDTITDFSSAQLDQIDLSAIDANTATVGNDAFSTVVVGGVFSGSFASPGDLYFDSINHVLYGNTNGDTAAEFAIALTGVVSLVDADLVL